MRHLHFILLMAAGILGGWLSQAWGEAPSRPRFSQHAVAPVVAEGAGSPAPRLLAAAPQPPMTKPTQPAGLGPFYKPYAPVRNRVGKGYVLRGIVRDAKSGRPLGGAILEFWLAGPDGRYDDDHRATVISNQDGAYQFECNFPPASAGKPPHINVRVYKTGHQVLATQHYPRPGQTQGTWDPRLTAFSPPR